MNSAQERQTFRTGRGEQALLFSCGLLLAILSAGVGALMIAMAKEGPWFTLLWLALFSACGALAALIFGEWRAARRLSIVVAKDSIDLLLPRRRGHVKHPAISQVLPVASIASVETRLEAFRQLGVTAIQRAFRLVLKDGRSIELGADREMKDALFEPAATAIAEAARVEIADRGMVDGAPGILAAWGTSVPDWTAPSLAMDEAVRRQAAAATVWRVVGMSLTLLMIARLIARR